MFKTWQNLQTAELCCLNWTSKCEWNVSTETTAGPEGGGRGASEPPASLNMNVQMKNWCCRLAGPSHRDLHGTTSSSSLTRVCASGHHEPSEEDHLARRRDGEAGRIPDVNQTEGLCGSAEHDAFRFSWTHSLTLAQFVLVCQIILQQNNQTVMTFR